MQEEEKNSLCSDCWKHGFPKSSKSRCQFCAHPLCDSHLEIHSKVCPQKIQICFFCGQQTVFFCKICFNFVCLQCLVNEQTWHEGKTTSHLVQKINESLIELFDGMGVKQKMEGINLNDQFLTFRKETVNMILEKLDSFGSLLVRSPAFSGKTSLATLIVDKLKKQGKHVIFSSMLSFIHSDEPNQPIQIGQPSQDQSGQLSHPGQLNQPGQQSESSQMDISGQHQGERAQLAHPSQLSQPGMSGKFKSFNEHWKSVLGANSLKKISFIEFREAIKENHLEFYVILDETQMIYDIEEIWQCFKELANPSVANLKLLCFAAYHRPLNYPTPFQFNFWLGSNDILMTNSEFHELINASHKCLYVQVENPELLEWLKSLTGMQIGILKKTLFLINDEFKSPPHPSQWQILKFLLSSSYMKKMKSIRSAQDIQKNEKTENEKKILKDILTRKEVTIYDEDDLREAFQLSKYGYFYQSDNIFSVPCPLIENFIADIYLYGRLEEKVLPEFNLDNFLLETLKNFHKSFLISALQTQVNSLRALQIQFFDSARSIKSTDSTNKIEIERFFNMPGLLHFYVNGKHQWGIQLLFESYDGGKTELNCFQSGVFSHLGLNEYRILNFIGRNDYLPTTDQNLWNINIEGYFSKMKIKKGDNEEISFDLRE